MKKRSKGVILSSLVLGGLILTSAISCGKQEAKPSNPNPDVNVPDKPAETKTYTVKATAGEGGIITPLKTSGNAGETVSFVIVPGETYEVETLTINGKVVTNDVRSFVAIAGENTIDVKFKETKGKVNLTVGENGKASADVEVGKIGDTVTITTKPNRGYLAGEVKHNDTVVEINEAGKATFKLVAGENNVTVSFIADPDYIPEDKPSGVVNVFFAPGADMLATLKEGKPCNYYLFGGTGPAMAWPGVEAPLLTHEGLEDKVWVVPVDFSAYDNVIFNFPGGGQTADIPLSNLTTTENLITTEGTEKNGMGNEVHSPVFKNSAEWFTAKGIDIKDLTLPEPPKPEIKEYGTYNIEFTLTDEWKAKMTETSKVRMHYWSASGEKAGSDWPGDVMTLKEGTTDTYTASLQVNQNTGFLFDIAEDDGTCLIQTLNADVDYAAAGKNATLKGTLGAAITDEESADKGKSPITFVAEGGEPEIKSYGTYHFNLTLDETWAAKLAEKETNTVNVHYWNSDEEKAGTDWPGVPMTKNADGTFGIDLKVNQNTGIIFTVADDKTALIQTDDIKAENESIDFNALGENAIVDTKLVAPADPAAEGAKYTVTLTKVDPDDLGTYKVYFELPESWKTKLAENEGSEVYVHYWGTKEDPAGTDWPGIALTKVDEGLFGRELHITKNTGIIVLLKKGGSSDVIIQSQNIEGVFEELGKNATVKITLDDTKVNDKGQPAGSVAAYEATKPIPTPEPIPETVQYGTYHFELTLTEEWAAKLAEGYTVRAHYWSSSEEKANADWPGVAMTAVEGKANTYAFDLKVNDKTGILFDIADDKNACVVQTLNAELKFAELGENASLTVTLGAIITDEASNDKGKTPVTVAKVTAPETETTPAA